MNILRWSQRPKLSYAAMSLLLVWTYVFTEAVRGQEDALASSLTFHASFDRAIDADFARGDRRLLHAASMEQRANAEPGLPSGAEVEWVRDGGRSGGALRFRASQGPMVFFRADQNLPTLRKDWEASIVFWLKTDPLDELKEGFCDPIQITSKQWDDAAIFVEFEKRPAGIPFRLGVYADKDVWNPTGRAFETIPATERPLAPVDKPPFRKDRWTQVAIVLNHFNTGEADGTADLYLDGELAAKLSPRTQTFTWDKEQAAIMLGLSYIGMMDDFSIFNRSLTPDEVRWLFQHPGDILPKRASSR